jgi:hypothetical protein
MGSERGVATWEAAGVFVLVVNAEAAGESGVGAGTKTWTLYAGVSGNSGCWMTGAEDVGRSFGSSENLRGDMILSENWSTNSRTHFLPNKLRKAMMVFALFFTSWGFASLPMYFWGFYERVGSEAG